MNTELFNYNVVDGREGFSSSLSALCQLRYQVYVNEWGYESPEDHPGGLERDEYDQHSIHFYACPKHSDDVIGAARIILGSERPLPIERHFDIDQLPSGVRREQSAEISRLAVSKEFRCHAIDRAIYRTKQIAAKHMHLSMDNDHDFRRHCEHQLVRGMYINIYRQGRLRGLTHFTAVMTRGLYIILKRWGINFIQLGPEQDYHGIRAPYLVSLDSIAHSWERMDPDLYRDAHSSLTHCH